MTRPIPTAALDLIKAFERFEPDWYLDPVGVRTIAYGWTGRLPAGMEPPLVEPEAAALLVRSLEKIYAPAVLEAVTVPLSDSEYAALLSLCYNIGPAALATSTLVRRLNAEDRAAAADEFLRWVYAGGRVWRGLQRRREAERALFLTPDTPTVDLDALIAAAGFDSKQDLMAHRIEPRPLAALPCTS